MPANNARGRGEASEPSAEASHGAAGAHGGEVRAGATADQEQSGRATAGPNGRAPRDDGDAEGSDCIIVCVGASAGGLDAFETFLREMPDDSGMAFVLIQHLAPDRESLLVELLSGATTMPVTEVTAHTAVAPDHVYVIPPGKLIELRNGSLVPSKRRGRRGAHRPLDHFFRSLAENRRERAIGVVLTGAGSDGTIGLEYIKAKGGMVMAQDPEGAEFDGMPSNAVSSGLVDYVLPIDEMPPALVRYAGHSYTRSRGSGPTLLDTAPEQYRSIIDLLRARTDSDFRYYKTGTLSRRIQRRMGVRAVERPSDYLRILREDAEEVDRLFRDLLIGVTSFFREPEAWTVLTTDVLRPLLAGKGPNEPLRAWVAGCATGEEAYSLAILVHEELERAGADIEVQIFASDLDAEAIARARQGLYPRDIEARMSPERLAKFFEEGGDHYRAGEPLRESVVFAEQNLIADPPFSNLDLITCRNVLIYLEQDVQQQLIDMFGFALRQGGYLFVGTSESIGERAAHFRPVSPEWRIYRKAAPVASDRVPFAVAGRRATRTGDPRATESVTRSRPVEDARRLLMDRYAPAAVLVDHLYEVHYFHGPVQHYLSIPSGAPTLDIRTMCRPGLLHTVRTLVHRCVTESDEATEVARLTAADAGVVRVEVRAMRVPGGDTGSPMVLLAFTDADSARPGPPDDRIPSRPAEVATAGSDPSAPPVDGDPDGAVGRLERELMATRADLQTTIEELETASEEMSASYEEMRAMNSELQSANEELATSREELQSMNEELATVNAQLGEKVRDVETANDDLTNLLVSTDIATLFLDRDFRIRRYTPASGPLLHLIAGDVGRPIRDLAPSVRDPRLLDDARAVLETLEPIAREVELRRPADGSAGPEEGDLRWFSRRVLPYRTGQGRVDGVVVTYTDVSEMKATTRQLERRGRQTEVLSRLGHAALGTDRIPELLERAAALLLETLGADFTEILELMPDGRELFLRTGVGWSPGTVGDIVVSADDTLQAGYALTSQGPVVVPDVGSETRFGQPEHLAEHGVRAGISVAIGPPASPWGVLGVHARTPRGYPVDESSFVQAVASVLWSAIDRIQAAETVGRQLAEIDAIYRSAPVGLGYLDRDLRYVRVNQRLAEIDGTAVHAHVGRLVSEVVPELAESLEPVYRRVVESGEPALSVEISGRTPASSELRHWLFSVLPLEIRGEIVGVNTVVQDFTERKDAEHRLRADDRGKDEFIAILAHELRNPLAAIRNAVQALELAGIEDPRLETMGDVVRRQVDHMVRLIEDLLHVQRVARGKIVLKPESVDLGEIIRLVAADLEGLFHESSIELTLSLPDEPVRSVADPTRLSQCFGNLLHNALKFTDHGGRVWVTLTRTKDEATVTVRDTGIGMDPAFVERLFEPFRQADRSLHRTKGGLGLGLAMVKGLVEMHEGTFTATSEGPGRGAEFTIRLPLKVP